MFPHALVAVLCVAFLTAGPATAQTGGAPEPRGGPASNTSIERVVEAMGGARVVDSIGTLVVEGSSRRRTPHGWLETPTRTLVAFPASFRHEIEVNGQRLAMASSPEGAFLLGTAQILPLSVEQRQNVEATALRNPLVLLKGRRNALVSFEDAGEAEVDGRKLRRLDAFVGNESLQLLVDGTGRIAAQEFRTVGGVPEREGRMVVTYEDFRTLPEGLVMPFRMTGVFEGDPAFSTQIRSVRFNVPLARELFVPPTR